MTPQISKSNPSTVSIGPTPTQCKCLDSGYSFFPHNEKQTANKSQYIKALL